MIALGSDHAGYALKKLIAALLVQRGLAFRDYGCDSDESCHYPYFAALVADAVAKGEAERGILVCGTGIGMSIAANKFDGIRATLCHDDFTARACREHNNSNILCLGARCLTEEQALNIVKIWLDTEFAGGRHQQRLDMITQIEKEN